eukprot:1161525-Pelagomonas_calceolata.AAC.5
MSARAYPASLNCLHVCVPQTSPVSPSTFPDPGLPGLPAYDLTHWLHTADRAPHHMEEHWALPSACIPVS